MPAAKAVLHRDRPVWHAKGRGPVGPAGRSAGQPHCHDPRGQRNCGHRPRRGGHSNPLPPPLRLPDARLQLPARPLWPPHPALGHRPLVLDVLAPPYVLRPLLHSLPPFPSRFSVLAAPFPPHFSALAAPFPPRFSALVAPLPSPLFCTRCPPSLPVFLLSLPPFPTNFLHSLPPLP